MIKTCKNCHYNKRGICQLSGLHQQAERLLQGSCDKDFSGWQKKQGLKSKILKYITK